MQQESFLSGSIYSKIHATLMGAQIAQGMHLLEKQSKDHNQLAADLKSFLGSQMPSWFLDLPSSVADDSGGWLPVNAFGVHGFPPALPLPTGAWSRAVTPEH